MTDGMTILAELAAEDDAMEASARVQIGALGWTIKGETPGWIRAQKGSCLIAQPTFRDLLSWIEKRGARQ